MTDDPVFDGVVMESMGGSGVWFPNDGQKDDALLAAAPDLYEALKWLEQETRDIGLVDFNAGVAANTALAKARGEGQDDV